MFPTGQQGWEPNLIKLNLGKKCLNATLLDNTFIPESTVSFNNKNEDKLETEELELDMDAIGEQNQETSELIEADIMKRTGFIFN